ncbi:MAG: hypothetical protein Q8R92_11880 [Deltaproteobacteria bacterium]|nr:hypothetical protein [Deltaproteobacteria bacterium]
MRYAKFAILITAVILATASTAIAREGYKDWSRVGENPVCDSVERSVDLMQVPAALKPEFVKKIKASTIERQVVLTTIDSTSASPDDKALAKGIVSQTCFKFFALEYFRDSRKLHPEIMRLLEAKVDKSLYTLAWLKKGDTFDRMTFGSPARVTSTPVIYTGPDDACPIHIYTVKVGNVEGRVVLCTDCDNLGHGWKRGPLSVEADAKSKGDCVEVSFNTRVVGEKVRWGVGTSEGPLPPSECNAQRQGAKPWTAWWGECDICIPPFEYLETRFGGAMQVLHRYLYPVKETRQTLRFSTAVWSRLLYLCLESADGRQTTRIVSVAPKEWQGRHRLEIQDSQWAWIEKHGVVK